MLEQTIADLTIGQLISYGLMAYGGYLVTSGIAMIIAYYIINKYFFK